MRRVLVTGLSLLLATAAWMTAYRVLTFTWTVAAELDRAAALAELTPPAQSTMVFDRHGRPAFSFFAEQRINVSLDDVSPLMVQALLAVEDQRFFSHNGLDPIRIAGAAWKNVRQSRIVEGGSTLTQQLARASQLSPRRTFERKIREAMIAARLEQRYSKREILEAYLNTVYFGEGYYGVEAASRGYFGRPASELDAAQAALLAALVRSPSHDAPCVSPDRALKRRNLVLRLMRDQRRIDDTSYRAAAASPISDAAHAPATAQVLAGGPSTGKYFEEELRRQLVAQFGNDRVLRGGLRVFATYDPELQRAAEEAVRKRIAQIAKVSTRARALQGSLVSIDAATGDVLALVGGRDFEASSFNRATQARRQAGSAFKPIVYAAALERGYGPATRLTELDVPIHAGPDLWLPGGEHEAEEYTLRRALKLSSNRAAAQLLQQIGTSTTVHYAQRLGIDSPLPMVPSLALGTGEVTLLELTAAYTAFANRGITSGPRLFTRVEDSDGNVIFHQPERHVRAISEATAYMMSSMLADVVTSGTATRVRGGGFKLPAAGKTGTSDDYADAWFIGYTPHLVTGVWFGLDVPAPIMTRGFASTVAVPAWTMFMKAATREHKPAWFQMPSGVEKVAICRISGARATNVCRHHYVYAPAVATATVVEAGYPSVVPELPPPEPAVFEELYQTGSVSSELCPVHVDAGATTPSTPLVDAALQRTPTPSRLRRVVGADGMVRLVSGGG